MSDRIRPGETISGLEGPVGFLGTIMGGFIGGILGIVIALPVVALFWIFGKVCRLFQKKDSTTEEALPSQQTVSVVEGGGSQAPPVQKTAPPAASVFGHETDDAVRRRIVLSKASVDIWFYPKMGIARRTMHLTDARLRKKLGKRLPLPELGWDGVDQAGIEQQTREDAENVLKGFEPKPREARPAEVTKQQVMPVPVAPESPVVAAVPEMVPEKQFQPTTSLPEKKAPRNKMVSYRGKIVKAGRETFTDPKDEKRQFDCFAVTLDDFALGSEHVLKGTDLERAIKDSKVEIGDDVTIDLVGETEVWVKGKHRMKKIWNINKTTR